MSDRDAHLLALRPTIESRAASGVEGFMHGILRPVLKVQNQTILALVAADVRKRIPGFEAFSPDDRRQRLGAVLLKDSRLKRVLLGVVLGALTADELAFALDHEAEVRRRMVSLLRERVVSQTEVVSRMCERCKPAPMAVSLRLSWNNGSLPLPHRRSATITLHEDGTGTVVRTRGYGDDDQTTTSFRLDAPEALAQSLRDDGLWRTAWREPERTPVGGGLTYLTATCDGETVTVPPIVVREQAAHKKALVQLIRDAVLGTQASSRVGLDPSVE